MLKRLAAEKKIVVDHVRIESAEIEQSGEYDLEGLFVRLGYAIDTIGAKRVVLDTVEALFAGLSDTAVFAPNCDDFCLAQGQGRHGGYHRRSVARANSPATALKNMFPIA